MPGIILEGGTFRPIFSAGVMDALLEIEVFLDWISYMTRSQTNCIHLTGRHSMNTKERSRSV